MTDQNAQYVAVATGTTNPTAGSTVVVDVTDLTLAWEIQDNAFGDKLPIIPRESHVEHGKVLYRLKIKARLRSLSAAAPVAGRSISITSNRTGDRVQLSPTSTDSNGAVIVTLEGRDKGARTLTVTDHDITAVPLDVTLSDAWYESTFLITAYNVCNETDFGWQMVTAPGLGDQHRNDFLNGASGVVMQGTGMALNGRYVRPTHVGTHWHLNAQGHPDHLEDPQAVTFAYSDGVLGAFGTVTENHSIAVDPTVIPPRARVNIDAVGERYADDRGSQIQGYHVDNFLGAGHAVVQTWTHGAINGTQRKVKYLGGT
ncbi:3D domain-containing protein [Paraburkholderia bryophila]|jgi:3D (Asp-Asp-Asp) domain-containing protein|nr:3D domain-containing protein [Paraburkholderia bryophila]